MAFSDFVSGFKPFQTPSPAQYSLLSPYLNLSPTVPLFSLHTTHVLPPPPPPHALCCSALVPPGSCLSFLAQKVSSGPGHVPLQRTESRFASERPFCCFSVSIPFPKPRSRDFKSFPGPENLDKQKNSLSFFRLIGQKVRRSALSQGL